MVAENDLKKGLVKKYFSGPKLYGFSNLPFVLKFNDTLLASNVTFFSTSAFKLKMGTKGLLCLVGILV